MPYKKKKWLSPSGLSTLDECPRCFWLKYNAKIYWPEAFASRLPVRYDSIIKKYFDGFRGTDELPPLVAGTLGGKLEEDFQETYFYHHSDNEHGFMGKLDEALITTEGKWSPVDHKTSSSDPRVKAPHPAYQNQLDAYAWLMELNKKPTSGEGHLVFFYPEDVTSLPEAKRDDLPGGVYDFPIAVHVVTLKTNPESTKARFLKGVEVLSGPIPEPGPECKFCPYRDAVLAELS